MENLYDVSIQKKPMKHYGVQDHSNEASLVDLCMVIFIP